MSRPRIIITPHTETHGSELPDPAISLSHRYADAILAAGGLPLVLPCLGDESAVREAVRECHGVLLSGGEDVAPDLYSPGLPDGVQATVVPASGARDLCEFMVINEVFRQSKPLLAICRGQQILNVALGGDLIADIALQCPNALQHNRQEERFQPVHEVRLEPGSLISRLTGHGQIKVNSTHHQAARHLAPPLRATGRSPDGIIEVIELQPNELDALPFLLAVQFHPERLFDRFPEHARLFEAFIASCLNTGPSSGPALFTRPAEE
jgi:putative glutamine amidotransferase